jgi:hypothetical protein
VSRVAQSVYVWLRAGRPGDRGSIPGCDERIFPLASVSRPALEPTQPPVQWIPGVLSPGLKRGRGVTLTIHPLLVPRSRMSGSYNSSPPSAFISCSGTALVVELVLNWIKPKHLTHDEEKEQITNKKFWKELIRLLSLHYLTINYQSHSLTTVNYIPWLLWLHRLPCVTIVKNWTQL